jgi:asparagine synthase (glutamine-hydrolysing)
MCGIAGVVLAEGEASSESLTEVGSRMITALHHRGPDACGVAVLPGNRGVFAHTRLKVVDLSERAAQPFETPNRAQTLTFNGEIYNFRTLRSQLEGRGASFRSTSDTEVIATQYAEHGLSGLYALDGMFALGLWDRVRERLILLRDRLGKKPLYWALAGDGALVFASEPAALSAYPKVRLELEPKHLPEYLAYGYVSTPNSIYKGVFRLPPATRLIFEPGREPRKQVYWSLPAPQPGATGVKVPIKARLEAVRTAVGKAVEKRLLADVPLGAFLSGGVDSSIVVREMARLSPKPVRTFSVGFADDATFDETQYAREVAEQFGTEHHEIRVDPAPVALMERLLDVHGEPYGDSSALASFAVAEATRKQVTVVLTGDGGDELFGGYTRFRGGQLAGHVPPLAAQVARRVLSGVPEPRGYKHPLALLKRFVEYGDRSEDEQLLAWNAYFAGDRLRRLLRPEGGLLGPKNDPWEIFAAQAGLLAEARSKGSDRLDQILRHNLSTYLLDDLLVKTDRTTMAVALEARCPFLDVELTEFAFSLPSSLKIRRGELKWVLREAYRGILSPRVLDRKKHGFGVPVGRWWSGRLRDLVGDLLLDPASRLGAFLDRKVVGDLVQEHWSGSRDHGGRIFVLLQLELWMRRQPRALDLAA